MWPEYIRLPGLREQRVVDRDEDLGRDAGDEGDRVAARGPRGVERVGEHVDRPRVGVVGVTGVEERGLAVGAQDDPDVGDARHRVVVERVQLTDRASPSRRRPRTAPPARVGTAASPSARSCVGRQRVGVHGRARVGPDESRRALRVEVVGVVVGDEDGVETA